MVLWYRNAFIEAQHPGNKLRLLLLLGRIALLRTEMRPIEQTEFRLSVGLSVCHDREPCKNR